MNNSNADIINIGINSAKIDFKKLVLNTNLINSIPYIILIIVPNGSGKKILRTKATTDNDITYSNFCCLEDLMLSKVVNRHILTYTSIKHKKNPLMFINVSFGVLIAFHIV